MNGMASVFFDCRKVSVDGFAVTRHYETPPRTPNPQTLNPKPKAPPPHRQSSAVSQEQGMTAGCQDPGTPTSLRKGCFRAHGLLDLVEKW